MDLETSIRLRVSQVRILSPPPIPKLNRMSLAHWPNQHGPSKAGHEALVAIMAQDLEGTGVTANVLVPGGATHTNMTAANARYDPSNLLKPEAMQAPAVWLASEDSGEVTGQRLIAYYWDESLPIQERLEKCGAPAAWPQLGLQMIPPRR